MHGLYYIKINFNVYTCSGQYLGIVEINKNNKTTDTISVIHADMHTDSNHLSPFLLLLNIKKREEKHHYRNRTTLSSLEKNKYHTRS